MLVDLPYIYKTGHSYFHVSHLGIICDTFLPPLQNKLGSKPVYSYIMIVADLYTSVPWQVLIYVHDS